MSDRNKRTRRRGPTAGDQSLAAAKRDIAEHRWLPALEKLDAVLGQGQTSLEAWRLAAEALLGLGEYAHAIDLSEQALAVSPDDPLANFLAGNAYYQVGEVSRAVAAFRKATRGPTELPAWCNLATVIPGDPRATGEQVLEVRRAFARRLERHEQTESIGRPDFAPLVRPGLPEHRRVLRVGYVSAYFGFANYMRPVWNLVTHHHRDRVAVHLFADARGQQDLEWFEPGPQDKVYFTTELANCELAEKIRGAQLDIVVDLNGYSVPGRLGLWTYRLAPVVAAWFNMYATSGLPQIDYIIGDDWVAATENSQHYSEAIVRLPVSYLTFGDSASAPPIVPPPCRGPDDVFTFGSLVSQYKLTPEVVGLWSAILKENERTRLLLGNRALGSELNREYVRAQFSKFGSSKDQLEFLPPGDHRQFLMHYNRIDVALDTFPYSGGTTTTEAIWQGVPVITYAGDRWAARTSATLLGNCHLAGFIAEDLVSYKGLARAWSHSAPQLAELRSQMRDRLRASPVCDSRGFASAFEDLLCGLVDRGGSPRPLEFHL